jgi:hypothetical protein
MGDVTTSVNSALGWARLTSTGLSSNSPISGAIQAAAGLVIDNNMDAAGIFMDSKF